MLRAANAADCGAMGRIYCEAWRTAYRGIVPDGFLDSLTPENCAPRPERISAGSCLVWEDGGEVTGLVSFGPGRDDGETDLGEIRTIYVLPGYWRHGAGTELLKGAFAALKASGFSRVFLWTLEANARARRFYENSGMTLSGARKKEIAGAMLDECRYEKDI